MKRTLLATLGVALCSVTVADSKPTEAEIAKIKEAVAAFGCSGGKYEKETEGSGVFQADDVKCKSGQYDFRLTKDMKVFAITMD